jgi:hypothetical protein
MLGRGLMSSYSFFFKVYCFVKSWGLWNQAKGVNLCFCKIAQDPL